MFVFLEEGSCLPEGGVVYSNTVLPSWLEIGLLVPFWLCLLNFCFEVLLSVLLLAPAASHC